MPRLMMSQGILIHRISDAPAHCIHRNMDEPAHCIHMNKDAPEFVFIGIGMRRMNRNAPAMNTCLLYTSDAADE